MDRLTHYFLASLPRYWLGTEASWYGFLLTAELALKAGFDKVKEPVAALFSPPEAPDAPAGTRLEVTESIGVIPVTGTLVTEHTWWTEGDPGYTSYGEIKDALYQAALDPRVESVLLVFDTPGGSANGISEVSNLIAKIDAQHKPVHSYVNKMADSAGYWLAVSGRTLVAERMAEVGSIGVIAVHQEVTKLLDNAGIKPTVFRDGQYKALGGPFEVLTDTAKAEIQGKINLLGDEFRAHVAKAKGVPADYVKQEMGDGKTFFAYQALANRMVDSVQPFEEYFPQLVKETTMNKQNKQAKPLGTYTNVQAAAMLAAGLDPDTVLGTPKPGEGEGESTTPTPNPAADAPPPTVPAAEEGAGSLAGPSGKNELAEYLQAQLADANTRATDLALKVKALETELAEHKAVQPQLRAVAEKATNGMKIALGGASADLSLLPVAALLHMHAAAAADFQKVFPIGGASQQPDDSEAGHAHQGASQHQVRAVKFR